jgi:endo-1,4-beta-xylanase
MTSQRYWLQKAGVITLVSRRARRGFFVLLAVGLLLAVPVSGAAAAIPVPGGRPILGTAVDNGPLQHDLAYRNTVTTRYRMISPEYAAKWSVIEPARGQFNFAPMDEVVNFAAQHQQKVQGLPLVWWLSNPDWLSQGTFTRDELIAILVNHVNTVVSRYAGRVAIWDVANEVVGTIGTLHNNLFLKTIGPDYIDIAYRTARAADPSAKLFYNDIGNEVPSGKSIGGLNLVRGLLSRGVPIDGVGLQMHTTIVKAPRTGATQGAIYHRPNPKKLADMMATYAGLGLEVAITEMDVRLTLPVKAVDLKEQAKVYRTVLNVCMKAPNCTSVTTWGFTDRYSWLSLWTNGTAAAGLPFGLNFEPKPAAKVFFGKI